MKILWGTVSKALVKTRRQSPQFSSIRLVVSLYNLTRLVKHDFPFMNTSSTLDVFLLLHVPRNGFQDSHLPRDQGEFDYPLVPWVLLLALPEDRSGVCFFPVFRHLSQLPWLTKDYRALQRL